MLNERRRENLKRALNPRTVCYVGGAFLENTIQYNRRLGFDGEVWVVNPKYDTIGGAKCYPTVEDLPGAPDATFIAVNREMTNQVVKSLAARGAGGAICYAAGYSEVGGVGPALEDELRANAGDMALVGPNCYGINNFLHGVPLLAIASSGERVERGCAFIAQSGNLCINVSNNKRNAELAYVISCGNQAVLDIADYVDVLIDDPAITCFALFVEAIPDVAHFSRVALRALKAGKPIVAIKSGVSELGKKMALSHTASLAGDDLLYQALFDRLGIIRVSTPVELLETAKYITVTGVPKGRRLAVFTCSGGDPETVADLGDPLGVILPQPNPQQFKELRAVMPEFANVTNPFDYNTNFWGNYPVLVELFHVLLRENVDAGLLIVDSSSETDSEHKSSTDAVVHATRDAGRKAGVPVAYCSVMPEASNSAMRKWSHEDGIASLQGIREGVGAVARTAAFGERRQQLLARAELDSHALPDIRPLAGEPRALDEWQGKQALAAHGLPVPAGRTATIAEAAAAAEAVGFPVAVKLLSDTILHKTDVGGVALNLHSAEQVAAAANDMAQRLGVTQVLVEPMAPKPVAEMIIGITRSEEFGPVLVIGAGGVLVEFYKDAASLLLPAHEDDIRAAIDGLKIARLLDGFRGGPKGDREALVQAVKAVAAYAEANRDSLAELDVNPLFVLPEGQGVVAVDALIRKVWKEKKMSNEVVHTVRRGKVLEITIDNPPANAIGRKVTQGLSKAFTTLRDDPDLLVGIVTGSGGKFFSPGWDLKEGAAEIDAKESGGNDDISYSNEGGFAGITELWNLYKPVIAAINGYAVGGGWEIALSCDIQYAVPHATFFVPDVHRGFVADAGAIQILPRRLPHAIAMDVLLSGRRVDAEEALKWGLINEIVEPEKLMDRAREMADHLAKGGPLALQATKAAVRHTMHLSIPDCFAALRDGSLPIYQAMLDSEDAKEGPRAFAEKREPVFKGR